MLLEQFLTLSIGCLVSLKGTVFADTLFDSGTVRLASGLTLKGERYFPSPAPSGNGRGYAFYGYKYGQAERFQQSIPNNNFSYLNNNNAPKLGYACSQQSNDVPVLSTFQQNLIFREDCLYLDVYLPPVRQNQINAWPVLFWVLGGGFKVGNKDLYNGTVLAQQTNSIVVTVNFRLSIFGFLSTGDASARGNWGLGDVKLALNWTLNNIHTFKGDPSKVTIVGQSSGGALVSAIMLDDYFRGKVFAAVAMSGSLLVPWGIQRSPLTYANLLGGFVSCPNASSNALVACLKGKTTAELQAGLAAVVQSLPPGALVYTPVIDGLHIPADPTKILTQRAASNPARRKDSARLATFISGSLTSDGSFFLLNIPNLLEANAFTYDVVVQFTAGIVATLAGSCPANIPRVQQMLFRYYNISAAAAPEALRMSYYQIETAYDYANGGLQEALLYAKDRSSDTQIYINDFDPGFDRLGAFHLSDVLHIWRGELDSFLGNHTSEAATKALQDFLRQILYRGRSNFPLLDNTGTYQQLNQQAKWTIKKSSFQARLDFWKSLTRLPCPSA
ncbi:putative Bile salt-activated lipase [Hypsibius exemplaris]|uniref:Bile salt-activated lipase n=1 Tax=Hypsibius exemplaris TaxID=2072580 RepID=A0A9X6NF77_HYPEX|nr:putative Bile salt-activated lipase [Hypsibius exemplaris]